MLIEKGKQTSVICVKHSHPTMLVLRPYIPVSRPLQTRVVIQMSGDCILTWTNYPYDWHGLLWLLNGTLQSSIRRVKESCSVLHTVSYRSVLTCHMYQYASGKRFALSLLKHLVANSKVIKVRVSHSTHMSLKLKYPIRELPVIQISLISYNFHVLTGRPPSSSLMPPPLSLKNENQSDGYGKSNYKNKYVYFQFISPPIHVCAPHKPWNLFQLALHLTI